jgi:hypothetical protein
MPKCVGVDAEKRTSRRNLKMLTIMNSLSFSQKSIGDVNDPMIKGLISDVATIFKAELLQSLNAAKQPSKAAKNLNPHLKNVRQAFAVLDENEKKETAKLIQKINTAGFRKDSTRLGIDTKADKPASSQVDYEKAFAHLKGKGPLIGAKLDRIGKKMVVPFSNNLDESVSTLIRSIKKADPEGEKYADYLGLLDKQKLVELYEREVGKIHDVNQFFQSYQPSQDDLTKVRRTAMKWQASPPDNPIKYRNRFLKLFISRVRCADETEHEGGWPFEGEGIANDRIDLTAISLAPNAAMAQFGPQMVSDNFEDNREFPWNREIASFDLDTLGVPYPLNFGVTVTIAEIDYGGGFATKVREIYNSIKSVIVDVIGKIGEMIGGIFGAGEAGKVIGRVIGDIVVLGLGELVNVISRAVQDDVFPAQVATLQIDSRYSTFWGVWDKINGPLYSPEFVLPYVGAGGTYEVFGYWQILRQQE